MPAQTARARTRHAPRPSAAPRHARRVSGPARPLRPVPAGAPVARPVRRGSTGAFERLRALPDHRAVDGLLRSRLWIWVLGVLLLGIVGMQVSLLKLNTGISRAVTTMSTLERQNAELEATIGRLSSGDRIRDAASAGGMLMPPAGEVEFLGSRPERDARLAARRMQSPSDDAAAVMANGGVTPGAVAAPTDPVVTTTAPVDPATTATTTAPAATDPATTAPAATDPVTTAPAATDPATTAPPATTTTPAPGATAEPGTGAVAAPSP